jgi:N-acetyl-anhydromuramoyl-L-alanine amidase
VFKWLLLITGIIFFYLWFKGKKQAEAINQETATPKPNKVEVVSEPEAMVLCQFCKVHLPKSDALNIEDRFYCSREHLHALDDQGWLGDALWCVSPNQDIRPDKIAPELVVVHHISLPPGGFKSQECSQYIVDFFLNNLDASVHPYFEQIASQKVSSHFLITRTGKLIQFVSTQNKAWHAGASSFLGREKCNDFSIGIELEGDGDNAFEEVQYLVLANLVSKLGKIYPQLQIAGHSDIAPERKTDPGKYFDWEKFQKATGIPSEKLPFGLHSR